MASASGRRLSTALAVTALAVSTVAGLAFTYLDARPSPLRPAFAFRLRVVDEVGRRVNRAELVTSNGQRRTVSEGYLAVSASTAVAGLVRAPGRLAEPVVVGPESDGEVVTVRLWSSRGGTRVSYHATGDVMLARRFLHPPRGAVTATLDRDDLETSARRLVAEAAPLLAAATFTTVNLETVVGKLPVRAAAAGKDIVLQTPPGALAALEALGVDAAFGANNHARDFGDAGVASTRRALVARGIAYGGAGADVAAAARPIRLGRRNGLVVLAFSGLTGDGVNDALPPPSATVNPTLQDWVARRGHGGASLWDPRRSPALIRTAARGGSPVVVQLHRGFQYADAPPQRLLETARAAVDAGADLVVAHHPHVLQGFEWYRGRLIAFSLGNFLFDQNLLATYPGGFLRTVWEGDRLLEARFVPTMLVGYRPLPVAGATAERVLRRLTAASHLPAQASRRNRRRTALVPRPLAPGSPVAGQIDRNTLLLRHRPLRSIVEARALQPGQVLPLMRARLYVWGAGTAPRNVLAGRDVFGYGSFDDDVAGVPAGTLHWRLGASAAREQSGGNGYLVLRCGTRSHELRVVRPVSRIPIANTTLTSDAPPSYELRFRARLSDAAKATVRLDYYRFDAGGLSIRTGSARVARRTARIDVTPDGRWHDFAVSIGPTVDADFVLPSFVLTPTGGAAAFALDDVAVVEWRRAAGPTYPQALDYLRNIGSAPIRVPLVAHPLLRSG